MSQTKFLTVLKETVTRKAANAAGQGDGHNKRMYVGHDGSNQYISYVMFNQDWSDVGRIISATLIVYTDDFFGEFPQHTTPTIFVERVTDSGGFVAGNNADGDWDTSDYTDAFGSTVSRVKFNPTRAANGLNRIPITGLMNQIAPRTVKQSTGKSGPGALDHGLKLIADDQLAHAWSGWSNFATDPAVRPVIELVYDIGPTVPNAPTLLSPVGSVSSIDAFQGGFSDVDPDDFLVYTEVEVYTAPVTNTGQTINLNGGSKVWSQKSRATNTEATLGRSNLIPNNLHLKVGATYKWRMRHTDNESKVGPWTGVVSLVVTNTDPNPPTLTPTSGSSFASLNGVVFRGGTFSDPNGDRLLAYQVELSAYPAGDTHWDDATFVLWDTGKRFVPIGANTNWETEYTGPGLLAGTYYWRARQWDAKEGLSSWAYAQIVLTVDADPTPGTQTTAQLDDHVPWRIVIRGMGANRGPGAIVGILENAKKVGAATMYNSPGELHFTLPVDHPQISVIEPKQTHYAVEFYGGDGWREDFAGLVWDADATETDVIFFGLDYLSLFDLVQDERFDPANPDKPYTSGGSKYSDKTVTQIVTDQLGYAIGLTNSPVGFITVGSIAAMNEKATIWSTMANTLSFVTGLIDSHRQGTGKNTRIQVVKTTSGGYQVKVVDDPGQVRDDLRLSYGELVQGYRVVFFGDGWASRMNGIGRTREGIKVLYKSQSSPAIDQSVWGRVAQSQVLDGVSDENDLIRRLKQLALQNSKLGRRIAVGPRSGFLHPFDAYDITDHIPVAIDHGAVDTSNFGSGYWTIYGVSWEADDDGSDQTNLTILPRNDTVPPDPDLIPTRPINPQAEWQIGWDVPDPSGLTSKYWLDQSTGQTWVRQPDGTYLPLGAPIVLSTPKPPLDMVSSLVVGADGGLEVRLRVILQR